MINMKQPKIKVLFRLRSLEMGGVPRVVLDLLRNLPKDKFDLTLMLNLYQGELRSEIPKDIRLITLAKGKEDFSQNPLIQKVQLALRRLKLAFYDKFPAVLYKLKVKDEFDIEVAPGYAEFEWVLNSPNKKSRKIGWFHSDVSYDNNQARVNKRIELMKRFDWMIFGSAQTRQVIKDLYKVSYPKSSVIYNVINIQEAREKSKLFEVDYPLRPVFSSVGRLHSRKGYDVLIRIHKRLLDDGFPHSIAVIGGGNEMDNLKKQIREAQVEQTFKMLDTQVNPYPYIAASDFFILPSRSESYPLIVGEVLGLGKPIISTNVGGIPEMISHDEDGLLVNFDEDEIYNVMKRFLTEPTLVERLKKGAENASEKFDAQKIYNEVIAVFENQYQLKNGK
ncbi:glycosyltransferase [Vaginella massiliensis]|uniref:glycosyltransferase n=1 Tax=Vaginella massiliensis TaxID=1816680 RepID=UPI000838EB79|nr:glycosyltransferase [Vaginella massiliensis]